MQQGYLKEIMQELFRNADTQKAAHAQHFFKTGKGEYGEGDVFLGIRVPILRHLSRKFKAVSIEENIELLQSKYHEARLLALFLMVNRYRKAHEHEQQQIYDLYLQHIDHINNWDLVDSSAPHIPGHFLFQRERKPLYELAESPYLWKRRIAIMATFYFIKNYDFNDTLKISEILLLHPEDLIQKAVGWMLRETGNRSRQTEVDFLNEHYKVMPRTMLRYAIEKFPEDLRQAYLK